MGGSVCVCEGGGAASCGSCLTFVFNTPLDKHILAAVAEGRTADHQIMGLGGPASALAAAAATERAPRQQQPRGAHSPREGERCGSQAAAAAGKGARGCCRSNLYISTLGGAQTRAAPLPKTPRQLRDYGRGWEGAAPRASTPPGQQRGTAKWHGAQGPGSQPVLHSAGLMWGEGKRGRDLMGLRVGLSRQLSPSWRA